MNEAVKTILVLGLIFVIAIIIYMVIIVIIEIRKARRIRINEDLASDNKRLREENAEMRAKHANAVYATTVHAATISRLVKENEALEAENRALLSGTHVETLRGMRFVRKD